MTRQYVQLLLTCEDEGEAEKVSKSLLDKHLISCAKKVSVSARYWWENKLEVATETLLLMESAEDLFDDVEADVAKTHSYETFVLQAIPFIRISAQAMAWMEANLIKPSNGRE